MKGTWQGSGTWQTSGPDLGDVGLVLVAVAAAGVVVEVVLSIIVWIAVALGIASALAVVALVWRLRGKPAREARFAAAIAAQRQVPKSAERLRISAPPARQLPAEVRPHLEDPGRPALEPAREVHLHLNVSPEQLAAILRHSAEEK